MIALLALGGVAIANYLAGPPITRGAYVPSLSADPATAQLQALLFVAILGGAIFLTIGTGIFLAITFMRLTKLMAANAGAMTAGETAGRTGGPKAPAKSGELGVPLSSERSVAIFWIVLVLIVVAFQAVRLWGQPIGYLPSVADLARFEVFRLPGTHIEGMPPFIAGPGDPVTALHLLIGVLLTALAATAVVGFILARGFARLAESVEHPDQFKPTPVDRLLPEVEGRLQKLRQPGPRRFRPRNPIDDVLMGVNLLLLLVIGGLIAFYVVPSYTGVAAVDRAVEATRVAALATATPQSDDPDPANGESEVDTLLAEFAALPAGQASAGEGVFSSAGCVACHSLEPGVALVGPSLDGISTRAGTQRPDYPPEAYLYQSITNPNAFVVDGFQGGIMPQTFKDTLSPQQLADVIAFLKAQ
jgi:cytochrome c2